MTRTAQLVAFGACLWTSVGIAEAQSPSQLRVRLEVEVRGPYDRIGGLTWTALLNECQRIWRAEHVDVVGESGKASPDVSIPLVFDDLELERHDSAKGTAFGVTIFRGRSRQIVISAPRARQAAHQDPGFGPSVFSAGELDAILGRILGRVVAHEIGHVLLLKAGHGTVGLMRPHVTVRDLRRGDEREFALAPEERAWLAALFPDRYTLRTDGAHTGDLSSTSMVE